MQMKNNHNNARQARRTIANKSIVRCASFKGYIDAYRVTHTQTRMATMQCYARCTSLSGRVEMNQQPTNNRRMVMEILHMRCTLQKKKPMSVSFELNTAAAWLDEIEICN